MPKAIHSVVLIASLALVARKAIAQEEQKPIICPKSPVTTTRIDSPRASNLIDIDAQNLSQETQLDYNLEGGIHIRYQDAELSADSASLNKASKEVNASGNIQFQSNDLRFSGKDIKANLQSTDLSISKAKYTSNKTHFNGQAENITANTERGQLTLSKGKISTCPPDNETWHLSASELKLNEQAGWGQAKDLTLYLQDFPVFYFPKLSFPISDERKTGFLYPKLNRSTHTGLDFSIPYYLNLAKNYDATIVPRIMTASGFQISSEFRFLSDHFSGKVLGEYLPDDNNFNIAGENQERFLAHIFIDNPNKQAPLSYEFDFTRLSDDNYLRDLGTLSDAAGEYVTQQLKIGYSLDDYELTFLLNSDNSLNTLTSPYQRLPQITIDYRPITENFAINWAWLTELSYFDNENVITGSRFHTIPSVEYPMSWESGYILPKLEYPLTFYAQSGDTSTEVSVFRALPMLSIDSALQFDRYFNWRKKTWLQTLSPRLYALYSPHENQENINIFDTGLLDRGYQQLFRNNRFIGYDRIGDSKQLSVALETNFIDTERNLQTINARLGRAYYLTNPKTALEGNNNEGDVRHSPYITDLSYHINRNWFVTTGLEWEPSPATTKRSYFRVNYASEKNRIFNLTHRLSRNNADDVEQIDFSVVWPIEDNWHLIGRWQNDLQRHRTLETFFGVEYRDCCWSLRFVSRRSLDVELDGNGIPVSTGDEFTSDYLLEFVFNGLTSVGESNLGEFLEKNIYGYTNQLGN